MNTLISFCKVAAISFSRILGKKVLKISQIIYCCHVVEVLYFLVINVIFNSLFAAIVQVLLDYDPGLSKTIGPSNATPLISAATRGHTEVVNELLSKDGSSLEISRSNGKNALHFAARQGHVEVVKALLCKDPQLARRTDKKGQTALHMAVKGQSCDVVKLLLDADAAIVMLPDKFGNTALHVATRKKRAEVTMLLIA